MFNGAIPVVLDTLKQHYFIDRDGKLFRHILNYMRTSRLTLPENFDEFDSLIDEAKFYELNVLTKDIENFVHKKRKLNNTPCDYCITSSQNNNTNGGNLLTNIAKNKNHKQAFIRSMFSNSNSNANNECTCNNNNENGDLFNEPNNNTTTKSLSYILNGMNNKHNNSLSHRHHHHKHASSNENDENGSTAAGTAAISSDSCKILILNHTENNLYISGESALIKNLLPELDEDNVSNHIILNSCKYTTKFFIDGSFNIHHVEFMERLYNNDFIMEACYGGGLEGQQFNEYIFVKCKK